MSLPPLEFVSIDPGDTTGWAIFTDRKPSRMGEYDFDEMLKFIAHGVFGLWVIEDYIIRPKKVAHGYEHTWNKGTALRLIGAVEVRATQLQAIVVKQQPSIKPVASIKSGVPYTPKKKGTHTFDAVLHGAHFLDKEYPSAPNETEGSSRDSDGPRVRPPARIAQIDSLGGLRKAGNKASLEVRKK